MLFGRIPASIMQAHNTYYCSSAESVLSNLSCMLKLLKKYLPQRGRCRHHNPAFPVRFPYLHTSNGTCCTCMYKLLCLHVSKPYCFPCKPLSFPHYCTLSCITSPAIPHLLLFTPLILCFQLPLPFHN